jgi:hypothetical protein
MVADHASSSSWRISRQIDIRRVKLLCLHMEDHPCVEIIGACMELMAYGRIRYPRWLSDAVNSYHRGEAMVCDVAGCLADDPMVMMQWIVACGHGKQSASHDRRSDDPGGGS